MSLLDCEKTKKQYTELLTKYTTDLYNRAYDVRPELASKFSELRGFSIDTIHECGIFYIGDKTEMLLPNYIDIIESLGVISENNKKPIFSDRYIIPIKDTYGNVLNLVGYSKEANERYIYGTSKYYRRKDTLWGSENLHMAYKMGYAIITEGITDAICLRNLGYKNSFAMCGTHSSKDILSQLNRCCYGIIRIPDRDNAGLKAVNGWDTNRHITLKVATEYKDADEMCRTKENKDWFISYLEECISWIKMKEHRGLKCACEEVTIL